ncbi:hypothetical protein [Streptomyces boncukensis]|uniref:Uncharacterized protein n=1 Tax=Streptomyces boncukensis TaxID=2711219 RepID=A0A6G4WVN9_9ACTN|nr:hypothetical protein [Streptomyces boncukensis]NGO69295.1 hypothetical protein [Streptomyces boncukensis]
MATMCKLFTNTDQEIPPQTWTTVRFDVVLRDDGMYQGTGLVTDAESALIQPPADGDYLWFRFVHWDSITTSDCDPEVQFIERFVRDPYTDPDSTGSQDGDDTAGREFHLGGWAFKGRAGQPVAVEVWHNHSEPVDVTHAQFIAMTWDY